MCIQYVLTVECPDQGWALAFESQARRSRCCCKSLFRVESVSHSPFRACSGLLVAKDPRLLLRRARAPEPIRDVALTGVNPQPGESFSQNQQAC